MKNSKMKTIEMLDIFVCHEALNFSSYGASAVEKRRKRIPKHIFYPP